MIALNCKLQKRQLICIASAALSISSMCACLGFLCLYRHHQPKKLHTYPWQVQVNEKLETWSSNYPMGSSPNNYVLG